jgi:hypothetical protein
VSTYRFQDGLTVTVDDTARTVTSKFPDGLELRAVASVTVEDAARARELGYTGTDTEAAWAMHAEHDLLHHVVARAEGWPYSMVLRQVALEQTAAHGFGGREERLVFLLARALNKGLSGLLG